MAQDPTIDDAKRLAESSSLRRCIIIFERDDGCVGYVSYGCSEKMRDSTVKIMRSHVSSIEADIHQASFRMDTGSLRTN